MTMTPSVWVEIYGFLIASSDYDSDRLHRFLSSIGVREHRWWRRLSAFKIERIRAWLAENS